MRGKITRQELHTKLKTELDNFASYIISDTEPIENLKNGLLWFDPITNEAKLYNETKFVDFSSGSNGPGRSLVVKTSRVTLTTITNEAPINIEGFDLSIGHLEVIANGVQLYPEDYEFSITKDKIIKSNGSWNEHGGNTDVFFTYFSTVNIGAIKDRIPVMKPQKFESLYKAVGGEVNIPINIDKYNYFNHDLEVYYNGLAIHEGTNYSLAPDKLSIDVDYIVKEKEEFLFRIWLTEKVEIITANSGSGIKTSPVEPTDADVWYKIIV